MPPTPLRRDSRREIRQGIAGRRSPNNVIKCASGKWPSSVPRICQISSLGAAGRVWIPSINNSSPDFIKRAASIQLQQLPHPSGRLHPPSRPCSLVRDCHGGELFGEPREHMLLKSGFCGHERSRIPRYWGWHTCFFSIVSPRCCFVMIPTPPFCFRAAGIRPVPEVNCPTLIYNQLPLTWFRE